MQALLESTLEQPRLRPPSGLAWGRLGQGSWSASPACEAGDSILTPAPPPDHFSSAHFPPYIKGGDTGAECGCLLLAKQPCTRLCATSFWSSVCSPANLRGWFGGLREKIYIRRFYEPWNRERATITCFLISFLLADFLWFHENMGCCWAQKTGSRVICNSKNPIC